MQHKEVIMMPPALAAYITPDAHQSLRRRHDALRPLCIRNPPSRAGLRMSPHVRHLAPIALLLLETRLLRLHDTLGHVALTARKDVNGGEEEREGNACVSTVCCATEQSE